MCLILDGDLKKPIFSKHLSEWITGKVCDIYENGIPLRDISYQLNVLLTTVHNILAKGDQEKEKKDSRGRYPESFKAQDKVMVEKALKNCFNSYWEIVKKIASDIFRNTI